MRVALIRHAQYQQAAATPSALQPYPLCQDGRVTAKKQAIHFAQWLDLIEEVVNPLIHCSTSLRAYQTAEILADTMKLELQQTPLLCERSVGALANLTVDQIEAVIAADPRYATPPNGWKSNSDYCLPYEGAESLLSAGERVALYIRDHARDNALTLFVGHGASLRHAAVNFGHLSLDAVQQLSMYHAQPVVIDLNAVDSGVLWGQWKRRTPRDAPD